MSITPCNPGFGEVVLRYLQDGLSDNDSEGECTIVSDHTTEYADAEWQNQDVYTLVLRVLY